MSDREDTVDSCYCFLSFLFTSQTAVAYKHIMIVNDDLVK